MEAGQVEGDEQVDAGVDHQQEIEGGHEADGRVDGPVGVRQRRADRRADEEEVDGDDHHHQQRDHHLSDDSVGELAHDAAGTGESEHGDQGEGQLQAHHGVEVVVERRHLA